ncbi:MAG: glycerate-2-kinase family protein, partial [Deltaproteobacteria bacterium]|nr:glycerate-2-kinase family protein [Deltaproteobacteria bacterium]
MLPYSNNLLDQMRSDALKLFQASLKPVNPYEAIHRFVRLEKNHLILGRESRQEADFNLENFEHIYLVGGGKATAPMARAMEDLLGDRISGGLINVKYGFLDDLSKTEIIEADHPLPDQNGVDGTGIILDILKKAGEKDLIFSLISGGGSALLPYPAGKISLEEKQDVTKKLLECGASIDEINSIRKHISSSKGGQMARAAWPATTINLMLSDVVGDSMDVIASGPFVPDMSTFTQTWQILLKYGLEDNIPKAVREHLKAGVDMSIHETPKEGESIFENVYNIIIG